MEEKTDGSCLKQNILTFTYKTLVNIYSAYGINLWSYTQGGDVV